MHPKLGLFVRATREFARSKISATRKLYTDHIYPYPHHYVSTKIHPSLFRYRETWIKSPWQDRNVAYATWCFRLFWTYWWYMLFKNPHALLGHEKIPDPSLWSNEELGIPPDNVGPYREWLEAKLEESQ